MQSPVSPFTERDQQCSPLKICRVFVSHCFSCAVLLVDICRSIALCQQIFADSRTIFADSHTRNTLNSQLAAYDALSIVPESNGIPLRSVSVLSESSVASTAPSISTSALLPMSPEFLAVVATIARQVLLAQQVASFPTYSLPASVANSGGISAPPANSSQLAAQASSFAASGGGFASSPPATATPLASGRPNNCVVLTFVLTFSTPILLLTHPASPSTLIVALPSSAIGTASLAPLPVLHEPFVLGPGFSPVLAKFVSQIVARKFVELHELLPSNIVLTEPEPCMFRTKN